MQDAVFEESRPASGQDHPGQVAAAPKPLVLHLSADYPDPLRDKTTTAIQRLVTGTPSATHIVVSLKRTRHKSEVHFEDCGVLDGVHVYSYRYFGRPFGVGLNDAMKIVSRRIRALLEQEAIRPDIVHAHKLGFEGLAAYDLVEHLPYPAKLLVSVRGETERKILRYKPHYARLLQRIVDRASRVYYVSAWFRPKLNARLKIDPVKEVLLPNIVGNADKVRPIPSRAPSKHFVSVMNFDIRKRKGLRSLLKGFRRFHEDHPEISLDLIGGGTDKSQQAVLAMIHDLKLDGAIRMIEPMDNAQLIEALPDYLALALTSFNETFGMVYLEALFAGIPILYSRDTGIDGYLGGLDAGIAATPGKVSEIAAGFAYLLQHNERLRHAINASTPLLHDRFDRSAILERYAKDLADLTREDG